LKSLINSCDIRLTCWQSFVTLQQPFSTLQQHLESKHHILIVVWEDVHHVGKELITWVIRSVHKVNTSCPYLCNTQSIRNWIFGAFLRFLANYWPTMLNSCCPRWTSFGFNSLPKMWKTLLSIKISAMQLENLYDVSTVIYIFIKKKIATDCILFDLWHNEIGANIKRLVRYSSYLRMECMNSGENLLAPHLWKRTVSYFYLKDCT